VVCILFMGEYLLSNDGEEDYKLPVY